MNSSSISNSIYSNQYAIQPKRLSPATSSTPQHGSAQKAHLSKVTRLIGILALRGSAAVEGRTIRQAHQTGTIAALTSSTSALVSPFVYRGNPDLSRLEVFDLEGASILNGTALADANVATPFFIASARVTGGDMTVLAQPQLIDFTLLKTTDTNPLALATLSIVMGDPSTVHVSTIGHSQAGFAFSYFSYSFFSEGQRENRMVSLAPCLDTSSQIGFQIEEFTAAKALLGQIEHALPLPGNFNVEQGFVQECTSSPNGFAAVIYRHQDGSVRLASLEGSNLLYNGVKQDLVLSTTGQTVRLSYLPTDSGISYLAASTLNNIELLTCDVGNRWLAAIGVLTLPTNTRLTADIALVSSHGHFFAAAVSAQKPVLLIFPHANPTTAALQTVELSFLDASQNHRLIGLDVVENKILLLIAATKTGGEIEHQNWWVTIRQATGQTAPTPYPAEASIMPTTPSFGSMTPSPSSSPTDKPNKFPRNEDSGRSNNDKHRSTKIAGATVGAVTGAACVALAMMAVRRHLQKQDNDTEQPLPVFDRPPVGSVTVRSEVSNRSAVSRITEALSEMSGIISMRFLTR